MARKISRLIPATIKEAMEDIHECAQVVRSQLEIKEDLLSQCLQAMYQIMTENGCADIKLEFTDSAAMFMDSSLEDYLDGEPFVAFAGEGPDGDYLIAMRVYQDPEDEDEDEDDEQTVSVDSQLLRQVGDLTYVLGDDGWELADVDIEDEDDGPF